MAPKKGRNKDIDDDYVESDDVGTDSESEDSALSSRHGRTSSSSSSSSSSLSVQRSNKKDASKHKKRKRTNRRRDDVEEKIPEPRNDQDTDGESESEISPGRNKRPMSMDAAFARISQLEDDMRKLKQNKYKERRRDGQREQKTVEEKKNDQEQRTRRKEARRLVKDYIRVVTDTDDEKINEVKRFDLAEQFGSEQNQVRIIPCLCITTPSKNNLYRVFFLSCLTLYRSHLLLP